jgi:hypothetical protein
MPSCQQCIGEMRSDEAGAACDQDMIAHPSVSHWCARADAMSRSMCEVRIGVGRSSSPLRCTLGAARRRVYRRL